MTKSMARNEAEASELSAVRQENKKTTYRLDVLERKMGDLQNRMNRMEASLQRLVNPQARILDQTVGKCAPKFRPREEPRSYLAELEMEMTRRIEDLRQIVATGWGQDLLPNDSWRGIELENPNDSDEVFGKHEAWLEDGFVVSKSEEVIDGLDCAVLGNFGIPSWLFGPSLPNPDLNQRLGTPDCMAPEQWQPNIRVPKLDFPEIDGGEPLKWNQQSETNFAVVNDPDEAKSDLAQLYKVGRADRRLRRPGLLWYLPPWPYLSFCEVYWVAMVDHYKFKDSKWFQDEIKQLVHVLCEEVDRSGNSITYMASELIQGKKVDYREVYNNADKGVWCICRFFQQSPTAHCSHAHAVLKQENVLMLTSKYLLNCWKKDFRILHASTCSSSVASERGLGIYDDLYVCGHEYLEDIIDTGAKELELKEFLLSVMGMKNGTIRGKIGKEILGEFIANGETVKSMMEERVLVQIADPAANEAMDEKNNIRNMSVIAHVDHGKSTLTDSLVAAAGIIVQEVAGDVSKTDTRVDEAKRGITIKSTGNSLFYEITKESLKSYKSERLWGENFSDPTTKKWTTMNTGSATCKRGFVQFYYEPIIKTCLNEQKDKLWSILRKLGVTLKTDEKELVGKTLIKSVMQTCLLANNALLEMMIFHLPFSSKAQEYRVESLYKEPLDDIYATVIRNYDPEGPLMLYVSKMISASDKGRFFAFGRVFSGKVANGMKVRIMGSNYVPGQKKDLYVKIVQRTKTEMGRNLLAQQRMQQAMLANKAANNLSEGKARASNHVGGNLASDSQVHQAAQSGGAAGSHDGGNIQRQESDRSTVEGGTLFLQVMLHSEVKSTLHVKDVWLDLQVGIVIHVSQLQIHYGPNMVVDMCKGVQYLNGIKDSVVAGFQWASKEDALGEENMRGIRFEVCDVVFYADAIHRGGGQVIHIARRVIHASQLTTKPRLLEPVYLVEIKTLENATLTNVKELGYQNSLEKLDRTDHSKFAAGGTQGLKELDNHNNLKDLDNYNSLEELDNYSCPKEFDSTEGSEVVAVTCTDDFQGEQCNIMESGKDTLIMTSETGSVKEPITSQSKDSSKVNSVSAEQEVDACLIRAMKFSVFLVVCVVVQCKVVPYLPQLVESLKRLAKSDHMVLCTMEESGEHICAGIGELHFEICLKKMLKKLLGRMLADGSSHLLCSSLVCPWMILLLQLYCWINTFNYFPLFFSQESNFKKYSRNFMSSLTNPGFLIKYFRTSIILRRRQCQNLVKSIWRDTVSLLPLLHPTSRICA